MRKLWLIMVLGVLGILEVQSQSIFMANGSQTVCSGNFESSTGFGSGGAGTPGYTNNENYIMTFCPLTAGNVVNFNFATCVIGAGDMLMVYNGTTTAAPLLGTYDASNPIMGIISAQSVTNPSGCLTFHFISDGAGIGNGWNAFISCDIPCQQFTIDATSFFPDTTLGGFIDVCDIDTARIEVTGIYPNNNLNYNQNNSNVNFYWYLDSVVIDSGSTLNFLPDSAGAFLVQVFAIDSLGCEAEFNLNYWVRVSSEPSFTPTFLELDTICIGESNTLTFGATTQTWSNADSSTSVPTTFLPDGTGSNPGVYVNTLTFSKFQTGAVITSIADITKFWAVMEHTFLGDLSISMTCPNGSSTVLKSFPGGGGTNLGEPCTGTGIGNGYLYEWFPTGNNQTFLTGYGCGCPNVTDPCSGGSAGASIPADSYTPFQTYTNMIGCPLNGTWSLTIVDQWGGDDGYLFSWGVDLDSSLYPNSVITYNPGIDSIWVDTALNAVTLVATNDSLVVQPQVDSATYCYTVNVLDGFGCTHDSTFCFFVRDRCDPVCYTPVSPVFGKNLVSCSGRDDGSILTSPDASQIPMPWSFIFTDQGGNVVHMNLGSILPDSAGGLFAGLYNLQLIDGNGCSSSWPVNLGTVNPINVILLGTQKTKCFGIGCDGEANALVFNGTPPYSFVWSNGDTLINTDSLCAGANYVIVKDSKGCLDTSDFNVNEPPPIIASISPKQLICVSNSATIMANGSGGTAPYTYDWGLGAQALNTSTVSPITTTSYSVSVSDVNNCPESVISVKISVRPLLSMSLNAIDTICPGDTLDLIATAFGGDSLYAYSWSSGLGNNKIGRLVGSTSQSYSVTISDNCGTPLVEDSIWVQVGGYPAINVLVNATDTICLGERYYMRADGRGGIGTYTYEWDNGLGFGQFQNHVPSYATVYSVTVTDECLTTPGIGEIYLDFGDYNGYTLGVDTNVNCDPAIFAFHWDTLTTSFEYFIDYGKGFEKVNGLDTIYKDMDDDGCHDISAKIITKHGCVSSKVYPCLIEVLPSPIARFDFESHKPDVLEHYVDFWDESSGASTWLWYSNDMFLDSNEKFSSPFPLEALYTIKLVVGNEEGCLDSTTTDLEVNEVTTFFFPTAFTPNGDNLNDVFKMEGEGVIKEDFILEIYDRWGGLVYKGSSRDDGWNGRKFNTGDELPSGTYSYYYSLRLHDNRKFGSTGIVHLIR